MQGHCVGFLQHVHCIVSTPCGFKNHQSFKVKNEYDYIPSGEELLSSPRSSVMGKSCMGLKVLLPSVIL